MGFPNRKAIRISLTADLKTMPVGQSGALVLADSGGQEHAFPYLRKKVNGISPFACIESGSLDYGTELNYGVPTMFVIIIGFWARRSDEGTTEEMLDDLAQALAEMVYSKYNAKFVSPSVTDYEVLDGIQYKFELHFVGFSETA